MTEQNYLSNSLLTVARQLQKAEYIRKFLLELAFRKEYDQELEIQSEKTTEQVERPAPVQIPDAASECLNMHVFHDKDYDIEEVKFWNFISKNKGLKPSVIRTVVYKHPESSYVVKKVPVHLSKPEGPLQTQKTSPVTSPPKELTAVEVKTTTPQPVVQVVTSKLAHFESKNYKMEDMILIDEDDDIVGYNELSDEETELAEAGLRSAEPERDEDTVEIVEEMVDGDEAGTQTTDTEDNYNPDTDTDNDTLHQVVLGTTEEIRPRQYKQRGRQSNANKRAISAATEPETKRGRGQRRSPKEPGEEKELPGLARAGGQVARVTRSRSKLSGSHQGVNSPASSTSSKY